MSFTARQYMNMTCLARDDLLLTARVTLQPRSRSTASVPNSKGTSLDTFALTPAITELNDGCAC